MMSEQEKKDILDRLWEDADGNDKKQIELCTLDIAMQHAHSKAAELALKAARAQMEELLYLMLRDGRAHEIYKIAKEDGFIESLYAEYAHELPGNHPRKHIVPATTLLDVLKRGKDKECADGIYYKTQLEFTYHSSQLDGCDLSYEQVKNIFDKNKLSGDQLDVDDIVECVNHFCCIEMIIDSAKDELTDTFIKALHRVLKSNTSDSRQNGYALGEYKIYPNTFGEWPTTEPKAVAVDMRQLLTWYNAINQKTLDDILDLQARFEQIQPFQSGNGRVSRLIVLKECLCNDITPFIIAAPNMRYLNLVQLWGHNDALRELCVEAQGRYIELLTAEERSELSV